VAQFLEAIVPGVAGFETVKYGEFETVQFLMKARDGHAPERFDAANMSDGTLRALAALVAAYQLHPTNASGFVAIEEPETSLHPGATNALVDALDEATLRKQILITTHSTEILDNPTIRPENIRVVQSVDGRTMIGRLDEASIEIVRDRVNTLGGLERDNLLELDLDDRKRQELLAASQNGAAP
jgi:predicted ATPase